MTESAIDREALVARHVTPRFNLADEPWISVIAGTSADLVSLRELFLRAHEFNDVNSRTGIDRFALLHLLEVFATDLPRSEPGAGRFDHVAINDYFDKARDRLWLYHPSDPFLQQPALIDRCAIGRPSVPTNSIRALYVDLGASTHTWWDHSTDKDAPTLTASDAEAAQLLITAFLFGARGNEQDVDVLKLRFSQEGIFGKVGGGVGMMLVARRGRNLYETLRSNILTNPARRPEQFISSDLTSVEGAARPTAELNDIELALWSQKAILLLPEAGSVQHILRGNRGLIATGKEKDQAKALLEQLGTQVRALSPHVVNRVKEDGEIGFLWADETRSSWRELDAFAMNYGRLPTCRSILDPDTLEYGLDPAVSSTYVETLGCFYAGNPAGPVLSGWTESAIPAALINSGEIVETLAQHLVGDGVLAAGARSVTRAGRMAFFPRRDHQGKLSADKKAANNSAINDALHIYWTQAEHMLVRLASHLAAGAAQGDGVAATAPDWWIDDVTRLADRVREDLLDQAWRCNPSQRLTVEEVRSRFRRHATTGAQK